MKPIKCPSCNKLTHVLVITGEIPTKLRSIFNARIFMNEPIICRGTFFDIIIPYLTTIKCPYGKDLTDQIQYRFTQVKKDAKDIFDILS